MCLTVHRVSWHTSRTTPTDWNRHLMVGTPPGIRYYSLLERSGYGNAAMDYIRLLARNGVPLQWCPLADMGKGYQVVNSLDKLDERLVPDDLDPLLRSLVGNGIDCSVQLLHTIPELWPGLLDERFVNIGYTVWETDRLPRRWPPLLEHMDAILVPCEFNRQVFSRSSSVPVHVIPHLHRDDPQPAGDAETHDWRARYRIPDAHRIFYTISTWSPRKVPWDTLHAFLLAFDVDDPVTLVIKTDPAGPRHARDDGLSRTSDMVADIVSNYADAAKVVLIDEKIPQRDIELLHLNGDCYVSLARGEGWGIGAYDAATQGVPVVMTGWGGQLDFLDQELSSLVDYHLEPVVDRRGYPSYSPEQNWARADISDAIRRLRYVYKQPERARDNARRQRENIKQRFAAEKISAKLLDAISSSVSKC